MSNGTSDKPNTASPNTSLNLLNVHDLRTLGAARGMGMHTHM